MIVAFATSKQVRATVSAASTKLSLIAFVLLAAQFLRGQAVPGYTPPQSSQSGGNSAPTVRLSNSTPYAGSVPQGTASSTPIALSLSDAIRRGLAANLGLLLESDNALAARGEKWKELSDLMPHVTTATSENVSQQNLAARGIKFPGVPTIVGPFSFFDTRAYLTQSLLNLKSFQRTRGAAAAEQAARHSLQDARDLVVLAVGNAYLQALAQQARIETAEAQVQTAQALFGKAADQQKAGLIPAIDALRSQVELQARQQQLIVARNDFAKQMLALARVIGLPPGQQFTLVDRVPYQPLDAMGVDQAVQRAYTTRSDYQAALLQVRAAEHFRSAATAEYFPSIDFAADYGAIGVTPSSPHGTFDVAGTLRLPIFEGGKTHADVLQAEATLRQTRSQLEDLRGRIDYDVRTALLDLAAAAEQVQVATSSVDLANQALVQARDRFAAGVSDNLEVIQAQEAVASASENYIASVYAHNVAKVELARATGDAEQGVRNFLKSN